MYFSPQYVLLVCLAISGALETAIAAPLDSRSRPNGVQWRSSEQEAEPHQLDRRLFGFGKSGGKSPGKVGTKPPKTPTRAPPQTTARAPPQTSAAPPQKVTTSKAVVATSVAVTSKSVAAVSSAVIASSKVSSVAVASSSVVRTSSSLVTSASLASSTSVISSSAAVSSSSASLVSSSSVSLSSAASITSSVSVASSSAISNRTLTSSAASITSSATLNGTLTSSVASITSSALSLNATSSAIANGTLTSSVASITSSALPANATSSLVSNATSTSSTLAAGAEPTVNLNDPASCALKSPAGKNATATTAAASKTTGKAGKKGVRRLVYDDAYANANVTAHLSARAISIDQFPNRLFVGYHGTQSENAEAFQNNGVSPQELTSGANAELGLGLYVADDLEKARAFANNAHNNVNHARGLSVANGDGKAVLAKVCKVFAKDATTWINTPKFWFPEKEPASGAALIKDDKNDIARRNLFEQNRRLFAQKNGLPAAAARSGAFVRFAPLDVTRNSPENQFAIPDTLQNQLVVKCFTVDPAGELKNFQEDPELTSDGTFPQFSYRNMIGPWRIVQGCA